MRQLIVLGASARAAAYSAAAAGFAPYAIDLFADRDLAAIGPAVKIERYPRGFLAALAAAPRAPWLYSGGLENFPRLVDRLANVRPLWGNPGAVLRLARNPRELRAAALAAGCKFPVTREAGRSSHDGEKANGCRWLIKPCRSGGGINVTFAAAKDMESPPRGTRLQQYIDGQPSSAVFVAAGGAAQLLGTTRQLLGSDFGLSRPFLYVGSLGPLLLAADATAKLTSLGNELARRCGLTGLLNVDFLRTESDIWAIEVNPRYSASVEVLERVQQRSLVALHAVACQSGSMPAVALAGASSFAGKAIVYAPYDAVIPDALNQLLDEFNSSGDPPLLADIPHAGDCMAAGQPLVTVFAKASSIMETESQLKHRLTTVRQALFPLNP